MSADVVKKNLANTKKEKDSEDNVKKSKSGAIRTNNDSSVIRNSSNASNASSSNTSTPVKHVEHAPLLLLVVMNPKAQNQLSSEDTRSQKRDRLHLPF